MTHKYFHSYTLVQLHFSSPKQKNFVVKKHIYSLGMKTITAKLMIEFLANGESRPPVYFFLWLKFLAWSWHWRGDSQPIPQRSLVCWTTILPKTRLNDAVQATLPLLSRAQTAWCQTGFWSQLSLPPYRRIESWVMFALPLPSARSGSEHSWDVQSHSTRTVSGSGVLQLFARAVSTTPL